MQRYVFLCKIKNNYKEILTTKGEKARETKKASLSTRKEQTKKPTGPAADWLIITSVDGLEVITHRYRSRGKFNFLGDFVERSAVVYAKVPSLVVKADTDVPTGLETLVSLHCKRMIL